MTWTYSEQQILREVGTQGGAKRLRLMSDTIAEYLRDGRLVSPEFVDYATRGTRVLVDGRLRLTDKGRDMLDMPVREVDVTVVEVEDHYFHEVPGGVRAVCGGTSVLPSMLSLVDQPAPGAGTCSSCWSIVNKARS